MTAFSLHRWAILLCAGALGVGGAQHGGKNTSLTSGSNTIAGPTALEGAPGSRAIIFSNFSGENQQYGITIVNEGTVGAALKDIGQFGASNFSAIFPPGPAYAVHISLNNNSSVEIAFDKSAEKSAHGKVTWRVDIVPRKK